VLDAQGIEKINRITAEKEEQTNKRTQAKDVELKNDNIKAEMEKRELDKTNEEDLAKQTRAVDEAKAREGAAAQVEVHKNREGPKRRRSRLISTSRNGKWSKTAWS